MDAGEDGMWPWFIDLFLGTTVLAWVEVALICMVRCQPLQRPGLLGVTVKPSRIG